MPDRIDNSGQIVKAFHSRKEIEPDPDFEIKLIQSQKETNSTDALVELCGPFIGGG